ncbi:MAG: NAD(P)H-hydrate dehydratase [Rhodocyclaceae bacterium]
MFDPVQPIYPVAGIRTIEATTGPTADPTLMERAGRAAAEEAVRITIDRHGPVLIVCGPGNNGGDGFVMARRLLQAKRPVVLVYADAPERLPADARIAYDAWIEAGGTISADIPSPPSEGWSLVTDALFGIGLQRPITGRYSEWIETLNALPEPRMAIDVPSGLNADTGQVLGTAFRATHTLTFLALKPGLLTLDGPDHAGVVTVRRLDIDAETTLPASGRLVRPTLFQNCLKPRPFNSHKGSFGDVGIIGGAPGMTGAALLAARAALRLGAGRVFVACLDKHAPPVDLSQPELMLRRTDAVLEHASVLAVGPGLGCSDAAVKVLETGLQSDKPLVLDADALNLLAARPTFRVLVTSRGTPTLITPHPAEAARLLDCDTATVQSDRVAAACALARQFNSLTVLKGCGSIIATPEGQWLINRTGHPGMATAGMGDVLTGLIASLLAQRWTALDALVAAVHLHGAAADRLSREGIGPVGLTAGEVIDASRGVFNGWLVQAAQPRP